MHCANESGRGQIFSYPGELPREADVVLVGTIHRVEAFKDLLEKLLKEIAPRLITVEISPFSVAYRKKREPLWSKKLQDLGGKVPEKVLGSLWAALRMPYEFRIPKELDLCPVVPVDLCAPARRYLSALEDLLEDPPEETFSPAKELAYLRLFLEGLYFPPRSPEDIRRERFMARKIKRLASLRKPLVHIGGWRHLPGLSYFLPEATAICLTPDLSFLPKESNDF